MVDQPFAARRRAGNGREPLLRFGSLLSWKHGRLLPRALLMVPIELARGLLEVSNVKALLSLGLELADGLALGVSLLRLRLPLAALVPRGLAVLHVPPVGPYEVGAFTFDEVAEMLLLLLGGVGAVRRALGRRTRGFGA